MTVATRRMTRAQARRTAIAAQGFLDPRPKPFTATMRHVQRVVDRVGVVQIDSVNVLARSQYLPFFSRLGPYDTALLDRARDRAPRRLVEYWAHEASLVPPSTWPLLDFRMRAAAEKAWGGMRRILQERPDSVDLVRAEVEARGPMTAREVEVALAHDQPRRTDHWGWNWSEVKQALEYLFWAGQISSVGRTTAFERRYAALAATAPPRLREAWTERPGAEADPERFLELVRIAARAHGVGTELCLADYFRLKREDARPAIARLVDLGELIPVPGPGCRAGSTPRHSSVPSTRSSGSASASTPSGTSTTASRSTRPPTNACTATTCCPSSTATPSWRAATSRQTGPPACSGAIASPGSRMRRQGPARPC